MLTQIIAGESWVFIYVFIDLFIDWYFLKAIAFYQHNSTDLQVY